jgi:hypothetical protein
MRALVAGSVVLVCYLVARFLPGPVLQLVAPWSSRGVFMRCLVGGF